jgi:hypothetical protein
VLIVGFRSGICSIEIGLVVVPLQGEDRDMWKWPTIFRRAMSYMNTNA